MTPVTLLSFFKFESKMIVIGDKPQVFGLFLIADVRIDVPTVALMLPDYIWLWWAFLFTNEIISSISSTCWSTPLSSLTPKSREFSMKLYNFSSFVISSFFYCFYSNYLVIPNIFLNFAAAIKSPEL